MRFCFDPVENTGRNKEPVTSNQASRFIINIAFHFSFDNMDDLFDWMSMVFGEPSWLNFSNGQLYVLRIHSLFANDPKIGGSPVVLGRVSDNIFLPQNEAASRSILGHFLAFVCCQRITGNCSPSCADPNARSI